MAEQQIVTIAKLSPHGEGIAYTADAEIYVPHTLVGEKLEVAVGEPFVSGSKRRPGKVISLLEPAAEREVRALCEHFAECGGCQLMHIKYAAQLQAKQQDIQQAVEKALSKLPDHSAACHLQQSLPQVLQPVVGMQDPYHTPCRYKSIRYFATHPEHGLQSGFFAPRSHNLVPVHKCAVEPERFSTLANALTTLLAQAGCQAYDSQVVTDKATKNQAKHKTQSAQPRDITQANNSYTQPRDITQTNKAYAQPRDITQANNSHAQSVNATQAHKLHSQSVQLSKDAQPQLTEQSLEHNQSLNTQVTPLVRAMLLRQGEQGQILLCLLVANHLPLALKQQLRDFAQQQQITSFYVGINDRPGNALFTDKLELIAGQSWISKNIMGQNFKVGPNTFLQVNYEMCEQLYAAAVNHCALAVTDTALAVTEPITTHSHLAEGKGQHLPQLASENLFSAPCSNLGKTQHSDKPSQQAECSTVLPQPHILHEQDLTTQQLNTQHTNTQQTMVQDIVALQSATQPLDLMEHSQTKTPHAPTLDSKLQANTQLDPSAQIPCLQQGKIESQYEQQKQTPSPNTTCQPQATLPQILSVPQHATGLALDLCCGVGTMSLALAQHFKNVVGVDIVENSIRAAAENAQANHAQVNFIAGDLSKVLPSLLKPFNQQSIQAVIADPARVGIGEDNARLLSKIKGPCRISLIYCALNALQRELPIFIKGGFKVEKIQGFDMFPHSSHVETLVLLSKA